MGTPYGMDEECVARVEMFFLGPGEVRDESRQPVEATHIIWDGIIRDYPAVKDLFPGLSDDSQFKLAMWV